VPKTQARTEEGSTEAQPKAPGRKGREKVDEDASSTSTMSGRRTARSKTVQVKEESDPIDVIGDREEPEEVIAPVKKLTKSRSRMISAESAQVEEEQASREKGAKTPVSSRADGAVRATRSTKKGGSKAGPPEIATDKENEPKSRGSSIAEEQEPEKAQKSATGRMKRAAKVKEEVEVVEPTRTRTRTRSGRA
jgi:hypothetical protein